MSECSKCHGNHYVISSDGQTNTCECVKDEYDPVERPRHYASGGIEPYKFISSWDMSYSEGNIVKYVVRWKEKGGATDLEKARWYLNRMIDEALQLG
jgi:hypothetical protein